MARERLDLAVRCGPAANVVLAPALGALPLAARASARRRGGEASASAVSAIRRRSPQEPAWRRGAGSACGWTRRGRGRAGARRWTSRPMSRSTSATSCSTPRSSSSPAAAMRGSSSGGAMEAEVAAAVRLHAEVEMLRSRVRQNEQIALLKPDDGETVRRRGAAGPAAGEDRALEQENAIITRERELGVSAVGGSVSQERYDQLVAENKRLQLEVERGDAAAAAAAWARRTSTRSSRSSARSSR